MRTGGKQPSVVINTEQSCLQEIIHIALETNIGTKTIQKMITRSESTNFSNLSPDLIHNFKQLFKFIDVDNDNSINKQDIQKLIRIINLNDKVNVDEMFPVNSDSITRISK
jgi:Ca2+-binding EF-hand superfamily protein